MTTINKERESMDLKPIIKTDETITILKSEYKELLITQGKYEELTKIYYDKTSWPTVTRNIGYASGVAPLSHDCGVGMNKYNIDDSKKQNGF